MTHDINTIARMEWREIVCQPGALAGRGGYQTDIATALLFALMVGRGTVLTPIAFLVTGVLAVVLHRAPGSFAGERVNGTLEPVLATRIPCESLYLGKALFHICYACCLGLITLAVGAALVAIGMGPRATGGVTEAAQLVVDAAPFIALVGIPALALLTQLGVLVSMRSATVAQAQQRAALVLITILMAPVAIFFGLLVALSRLRGRDWLLDLELLGEQLIAIDTHLWLLASALILIALNAFALRTGLVWSKRSRLIIV